ncbi:uncharacterized protein LOC142224964 [Haematobia irritans]|uniref:uncharacterized protein LOC142224964 n=1 Tax=Haematobia irritans TaxID=7368 RepID=UPI003F4FFD0A
MVERFHRQLKDALRASGNINNWSEVLPMVLLGIRSNIKEDLKHSPAELVYGQGLRLPGELVAPVNNSCDNADIMIRKIREYFSSVRSKVMHHNKNIPHYMPESLFNCEYVFLKVQRPSGLHQPYEGPFKVLERRNNTFDISYGDVIKNVHVDLLKPAYVDKSQTSSQPTHNITYNII